MTRCVRLTIITICMLGLACAWAGADGYVPGIKVVLEVRTPQGELRSYHAPGARPTYWAQDMPVAQGDEITVNPMITSGSAELRAVKLRLDEQTLYERTAAPYTIKLDPTKVAPGYHLVEVWAATKAPEATENTATTTFLVVPPIDSLLALLTPQSSGQTPPVTDEERLSCAIRSLVPETDKEITTTSSAKITGPTLFRVVGGDAAKEFFYTLSRDDQPTYTSPRLPLLTHVLLEPLTNQGAGQMPGQLVMSVRVGDGAGRFGPPAWITVNIEPEKAPK